MWHTLHPLLPLTAPSNVETMATASWNQFVTHSLHFVWSVRQSSGAAVGENGARTSGAKLFKMGAAGWRPQSDFLYEWCQTTRWRNVRKPKTLIDVYLRTTTFCKSQQRYSQFSFQTNFKGTTLWHREQRACELENIPFIFVTQVKCWMDLEVWWNFRLVHNVIPVKVFQGEPQNIHPETSFQGRVVQSQIPKPADANTEVTNTRVLSTILTRHYKRDTFQYQQIILSDQWRCESAYLTCLLEFEHFKATQQSHANYMITFYNNRCYSTEQCTKCRAPVFPSALSHLAINKQHTFTVSQTLDPLTQNNSDRWRLIIWVPNASLSHKDGAVTVMQPPLCTLFLFTQAETEALWGLTVILDGHLGFCQIER